jgi:UDP-N-acetylglucosamine--N-acetylmuramyl-(pentapeptide) pyrophosphoryl-undecaprenol N-acetylglucosamine transferase
MWKAYSLVRRFKPDAAIGVGGYASGPTLKAASWLNVPTFIQEQNSFAGVTNKLLAKSAKRIFVAYEGMDTFFDAKKIALCGNPVRVDILDGNLNKAEARDKIDIPNGINNVVLISGGSLGARAINEAILEMEEYIQSNSDTFFYWQVGKLYLKEFSDKSIARLPNVKVVSFIEDMSAAYKAADLVICRAGALTISELTVVGKPVILMPSPNVAEDHQTHNALSLVKKNAAIMVKDNEATERLEKEVNSLLQDENRRKELIKNIEALGKKDAARVIVKDIKEYLETKK